MSSKKVNGIEITRVGAVIFDLGGVFLEESVDSAMRFGDRIGLTPGAWRSIHHDIFITEALWEKVERGEMPLDSFAQNLVGRVKEQGVEITFDLARNFMGVPADSIPMRLRGEIVEACMTVRKRMPTALMTNNVSEWRQDWRSRLRIADLFDHVIDSCEVGMRKAEPGIYQLMESKLRLPPEALLFIDDLGVNLKPARARGWQTLKYDDTASVLQVLTAVSRSA